MKCSVSGEEVRERMQSRQGLGVGMNGRRRYRNIERRGLHVTRPWPSPTATAGKSRLSLTNTLNDASITTRTTSVLDSYHCGWVPWHLGDGRGSGRVGSDGWVNSGGILGTSGWRAVRVGVCIRMSTTLPSEKGWSCVG
jgi:hypothetical protein